jgi:hypothetical protein
MTLPRMNHLHYVLDAESRVRRAELMEWARWFEANAVNGTRLVGLTEITSQVRVSTVFIGINSRYFGKGPPLVFETLVFGGPMDGEQWKYASWDDAETGHAVAVRKARAAVKAKAQSG